MNISHEDFLYFMDAALDGMLTILRELGDERANLQPDLPGANSPFAILFHCVGVCNYWMGGVIAGRKVDRDREAEFRATGTYEAIDRLVGELKERLRSDIRSVQGDQSFRGRTPHATGIPSPLQNQQRSDWTQGRVLIHTCRELFQHLGQMELTRDILVSESS